MRDGGCAGSAECVLSTATGASPRGLIADASPGSVGLAVPLILLRLLRSALACCRIAVELLNRIRPGRRLL
jgi:hypothetical protein